MAADTNRQNPRPCGSCYCKKERKMITYASTYEVNSIFEKRMLKHSRPTIDIYEDANDTRTVRKLRVYAEGNGVLETTILSDFDSDKNVWKKQISQKSELLEYPQVKELTKSLLGEIEKSSLKLDENISTFRNSVYYSKAL
jgi:hypothetical protein